jgi:hypothetical protein
MLAEVQANQISPSTGVLKIFRELVTVREKYELYQFSSRISTDFQASQPGCLWIITSYRPSVLSTFTTRLLDRSAPSWIDSL